MPMAESGLPQSGDEQQLLQAAFEHPFEPTDEVELSALTVSPLPVSPAPSSESTLSEHPPTETDTWQSAHASQVSEWRAQSASARTKAELTRAKWEVIRAREAAERQARGQPPDPCDGPGHVVVHGARGNSEIGTASPFQRWERLSSPESSYPSVSFLDASVCQSPSAEPAPLASTPTYPRREEDRTQTQVSPSILASITDARIAPRTRLSLVLSSLAINLLLPFINGVMLGFGEIFAKDVIVGWFGWRTRHGRAAAGLGLWR